MIDRAKLAKILAHLGDADDPQVLAAARHAHRIVTDAKTSWEEVLEVGTIRVPTTRTRFDPANPMSIRPGNPIRINPGNPFGFPDDFMDLVRRATEDLARGFGEGLTGRSGRSHSVRKRRTRTL